MMKDIAVAVTCYNNEQEVMNFARALMQQTAISRIQLIVTCNSCRDISTFKKDLEQIDPLVQVYHPEKNLGYLQGCLYGVERSNNKFRWVLISNTDISFCSNDFFERALNTDMEDVWCIGPDIVVKKSGIHQNPFLVRRPSKSKMLIWKTAYSNSFFFSCYSLLHMKKPHNNTSTVVSGNVYAVHGSCMLLKEDCVHAISKEAKNIFMYEEELLIAELILENGKRSFFNSGIGIIHNENQVTGKIGNKRRQKWFKKSIDYIYCRF